MNSIISFILILGNWIHSFLPKYSDVYIYMIEDIVSPQQVIWISEEEVLFVVDGDILLYSIDEGSNEVIGSREPNEFVGLDRDRNIVLCSIEHFIIDSKDEFSTKFVVGDRELYFFETIRPIFVDGERIVAVTALDFLEEHFYEINIESGEMREIESPKVLDFDLDIPEDIGLDMAYGYRYGLCILEDIFGNLFVYREIDYTVLGRVIGWLYDRLIE